MKLGNDQLLRKASIERLSSPEQLDTLMRVTSPVGWLALAAVGCLILGAIAWGTFGSLNVKISGQGILLRGDAVKAVELPTSGKIVDVLVREGDTVTAGQVVVRVAMPEVESQISTLKDQIADLQSQGSAEAGQTRGLQATYDVQLRNLREQLRKKQDMVNRGLARQQDVYAVQGQIAAVEAQLFQSQLGQTGRSNQLADKRRQLTQLEGALAGGSQVTSPYAGRVSAVLAGSGQLMQAGSRLLTMESEDEPYSFVGFIPFAEGKKILSGMPVNISPSNVKSEEFGFILGKIESVSAQAVTPEEVRRTLNNDQLAARFAEASPFRIRVAPDLEPKNPSGFKWTSASGPPIAISSGTPCTVSVIVEKRRPISYVLPLAKKAVGLGMLLFLPTGENR
jgi:HlyD family secretion protein